MIIGVPKEIKPQGNRISMISAYAADLVPDPRSVCEEAEMIVKVKESQPSELEMLARGKFSLSICTLRQAMN
jgi:alanine dehydrogenase